MAGSRAPKHSRTRIFIALSLSDSLLGGVGRDLLLKHEPACLASPEYILIALGAACLANKLDPDELADYVKPALMFIDRLNMVVFLFVGLAKAQVWGFRGDSSYGLLCAILTTFGGGIVSDLIILKKTPGAVSTNAPLVVISIFAALVLQFAGKAGWPTVWTLAGTILAVLLLCQIVLGAQSPSAEPVASKDPSETDAGT